MDPRAWLDAHRGIAHRRDLARAGFTSRHIRLAGLEAVGRAWVATNVAPPLLRDAARHHGRLTCVTAAEHLGIEVLEPDERLHLWRPGHANARGVAGLRMHRAELIGEPIDPLVVPILDVLAHVATCLAPRDALVVWESALRRGRISPAALRAAPWHGDAARGLARTATALSESPLESVLRHGLLELGIPFRQQVPLLGHRVDFLIGDRLVVQADGYEYHRDARQRRSDIAHDALLRLHDCTPLRFDFVQILRRWPETAGRIIGAIERGLHR